MVLSHKSYASNSSGTNTTKEKKMFTVKEDIYTNDAGEIKASKNGLPKGWAKGKLLARIGMEISDLQAKEWGLKESKAKKPTENKAKG